MQEDLVAVDVALAFSLDGKVRYGLYFETKEGAKFVLTLSSAEASTLERRLVDCRAEFGSMVE